MSQDLKKLLGEVIEMHRAELCKMADLIYDFAEKSVKIICFLRIAGGFG